MKTLPCIATSAITAALVASMIAPAAPAPPKPKAAPPGYKLAPLTISELNTRLQAVEQAAWDWHRFDRCIVHHYRVPASADRTPVLFKIQHGCLER